MSFCNKAFFYLSMSILPAIRLLSIILLLVWAVGCSREDLSIKDPWIAEAPPAVTAQAGYLVIENHTGQARALIGVSADAFESIELHRTVQDEQSGLAKMVHKERVEIASGEALAFEPGGYHLMLIKPKKRLKEGDQEVMTLIFDDGQRLNIGFKVRRERFQL